MASGAVAGLISSVAAWAASKPKKSMSDRRKWIGAIGRVGAWGIVGILSFFFVLNPLLYAVWLPHEILTLAKRMPTLAKQGPRPRVMVGYVLSDSNGWVSLLRTGERRIYRFRSEDITARVLCRARSFSMPFAAPVVQ